MSRLYSTRFASSAGVTTSVSWSVPAGKRAVVKQLSVYNKGAGTTTISVVISGIAVAVFILDTSANINKVTTGSWVMYAGESIAFNVNGNAAVYSGGYLFDDP